MCPIILKLLLQEPVTQAEWQGLFFSVHQVCMDEKGPPKLRDSLKEHIMDFIKQAQAVSFIRPKNYVNTEYSQSLLHSLNQFYNLSKIHFYKIKKIKHTKKQNHCTVFKLQVNLIQNFKVFFEFLQF